MKLQKRIVATSQETLTKNRDAYMRTVLKDREPVKLRDAKAVVITVTANDLSMASAKRCVKSATEFGHTVEIFSAYTPKDNPLKLMRDKGFVMDQAVLDEMDYWSRPQCVAGLFLTNYDIWRRCAEEDKPYLILEHDAKFINSLPDIEVITVINLGCPQRVGYKQPSSKHGLAEYYFRNLQGSHAYAIHPAEARKALADAPQQWHHIDLFFNKLRVPLIQDYLPNPIVCEDNFSAIRRAEKPMSENPGYQKHKESYKFIEL